MTPTRRTPRSATYVAFGVLAAILLVVVAAVFTARGFAESRTEAVARDRLDQASALAAVAVGENVARPATGLGVVARSPYLQAALRDERDEAALREFARRLQTSIEDTRVAFVVAPDATVLAMEPLDRSVIGQRFDDRDWYRGVLERSPYLSEAYDIAAFDQPRAVSIAHDVVDDDGERVGIVTVVVLADYFQGTLRRASAASGSPRLEVLDQRGAVIAGSRARGSHVLSERTRIPGTDWTLVASLDADEAYADVRSVENATVGFVAIVCVLLLALGALLVLGLRRLADARRAADRREQAFELNDTIVQRLAVAHLALSIGRADEARPQVDAALDAGRRMIGSLADGRSDYVREESADAGGGT